MTATVLIVTNEQDIDADRIVAELARRRVDVLRCNTERLPSWTVRCDVGVGWTLTSPNGRRATSGSVNAIWWRRPELPSRARPELEPGQRQALDDQWQAFCESLEHHGDHRWVSRPSALRVAEDKVAQLTRAVSAGFRIPETTIVNDIADARRCLGRWGGIAVAKSLTAAHWETGQAAAFVFAKLIRVEDLPEDPEALRAAPVVLQRPLDPKRDVRATVVGDRILAAVTTRTNRHIDWRLEPDRPWTPLVLPDDVEAACRRLVNELGLRYAGIDLLLDDDGQYWFVEANPNGEWGWLVDAAGLPVVEALADELAR